MIEKSPQPRVGVGVFVFNDGRFLMGQRRGSHGEGSWSVPGGHLEFGESFEQTAEREVLEETAVRIGGLAYAATTNDIFELENKHYVTIWMTSQLESGVPTIVEPDKFVDMGWFDFDNLPQPLFLPWKQLLVSPQLEIIKQRIQNT